MIKYKRINDKYKKDLTNLINKVCNSLERKDFFRTFTHEKIEEMFDEEKTIIYAAFDEDKLVGSAQLCMQGAHVKDIKDIINLNSSNVVEFGRYLVLKEYRNQGIMKKLESILIDKARNIGYEYAVITVHPDNIASNKAIQFTGAKLVKTTKMEDYLRNIYLLNL